MGNVVAIEKEKPAKKAPPRKCSHWAEDPKAKYLLSGVDQHEKTVYFFKMQVTGLQVRIFGPYDSRAMAVECFDVVLDGALESFLEVENIGRTGNSGMERVALPENLTPVTDEVKS